MLAESDTEVGPVLSRFAAKNISVSFLVPTATSFEKSIMDATGPVREFLKATGLHDYSRQGQGEDARIILKASYLLPKTVREVEVSLYRPRTKSGDPRIWVYGLKGLAKPKNLLALFVHSGRLQIVNCSDVESLAALDDVRSPLGGIAAAAGSISAVASELLEKLRAISAKEFIKTKTVGDTGIGMTLEQELGIKPNARKAPDFKGIEIKATRIRRARNRYTLFAQAPSWKLSPIGSAESLLKEIGYLSDEGRLQFYHTLDAVKVNSQGLILCLDFENDWLLQEKVRGDSHIHQVTWEFAKLRKSLMQKHNETFWVRAKCRNVGADEEYHYVEVVHTRAPLFNNLEALIGAGLVTLDYTLSEKASGKVRDHGYLFKILPENFSALFPPPITHRLA